MHALMHALASTLAAASTRSGLRVSDWGGGLLSSVLFCAAFPGGAAQWAGWFAFVPVGLALHRTRGHSAFALAFASAVAGWLMATWWIVPGVTKQAGAQLHMALFFHLLFCLFSALPYGVAAWICARCGWFGSVSGAFKSAIVWTAAMSVYPQVLPGSLAHSQYQYPLAFQVLDIGGVPLLLFIMHLCNWMLVVAVVRRNADPRTALAALAIAAGVLASTFAYGYFRLEQINQVLNASTNSATLAVGIVQPNIPVVRRDPAAVQEAHRTLEAMTRRLAAEGAQLTIWPEVPIHVSYSSNQQDRQWLQQLVQKTGVPLLVAGYVYATPSAGMPLAYFNSVEWVREGQPVEVYRKRHLLPFAEYMPGERLFPYLRKIFPTAADYRAGENAVIFRLDNGTGLIPAICYEAVFSSLVADGVRQGGNILVNPVDDAWFGPTAGPEVHLALSLYRSVEFRMPVIRVANSGISGVILPTGKFDAGSRTPQFAPHAAVHKVTVRQAGSLYAHIGGLVMALVCALSVLFVVAAFRLRENPP